VLIGGPASRILRHLLGKPFRGTSIAPDVTHCTAMLCGHGTDRDPKDQLPLEKYFQIGCSFEPIQVDKRIDAVIMYMSPKSTRGGASVNPV
jgi:hypothetical protein